MSATLPELNASEFWLDADAVVDGGSEPLRAAEVPLGCMHRDVAEEKLDLLQLAASGTAESSTTPAEIVRRELVHANL